jgi:hypothetical protein
LESKLVNKQKEIDQLNIKQQNLSNQLVEISELKKVCSEERDSLSTNLSFVNAQLDSLMSTNNDSFLNYYWSSIQNIEQKIIKRTVSFLDGKQELSYWKIKTPLENRLTYEIYDSSKNLSRVVEEVLSDSVVYLLAIKYYNNAGLCAFEENTAFIGYEGEFQNKYSLINTDSDICSRVLYHNKNQVSLDKIEINNQTFDCVKWIVIASVLDSNNNEIDKIIQTNYLLKNKGIVYAERKHPYSPSKNSIINVEIIESSDF